jgi:hypothetical protein
MSIVTSQQLARYFEQYRATEITFNKEVIDATGLLTRNVYLKVADQQWPCIIYACSLTGAKVIASVKNAFFNSLRQSNSHVSLRCCFRLPDKTDPISFFVPSHAAGFTPYNPQNPDVQIIGLEFTQRPPDDLILILGTLLETPQGGADHPYGREPEEAGSGVAGIPRHGGRSPSAMPPA